MSLIIQLFGMKRLRRFALFVVLYFAILSIGGNFHSHPGKDLVPNCNLCHVSHSPSIDNIVSQFSPLIADFGLLKVDSILILTTQFTPTSFGRAPPLS